MLNVEGVLLLELGHTHVHPTLTSTAATYMYNSSLLPMDVSTRNKLSEQQRQLPRLQKTVIRSTSQVLP
jgi:hypothetical protein